MISFHISCKKSCPTTVSLSFILNLFLIVNASLVDSFWESSYVPQMTYYFMRWYSFEYKEPIFTLPYIIFHPPYVAVLFRTVSTQCLYEMCKMRNSRQGGRGIFYRGVALDTPMVLFIDGKFAWNWPVANLSNEISRITE